MGLRRLKFLQKAAAVVTAPEALNESGPMDITIHVADEDGQNLTGIQRITVTAHPTGNLKHVQILIDNAVVVDDLVAPYEFDWDTTKYVDGTHILNAIAFYKTRKSTAQIAVTVSNTVPPPEPTPTFGADLFEGFEWALDEPISPVVNVATVAELRTAVRDRPGTIIDGGARTFDLGGQLQLPAHPVLTTLRNAALVGGRVLKTGGGMWRLRNIGVTTPPVAEEDCCKGDGTGGGFLDIDRCVFTHAPRQGILLAPHSDVVVRNTIVRANGRDPQFDHGIYTATGSRLLLFNSVFEDNAAYQLHLYPSYRDIRAVCCSMIGGKGSIVSGVTNVQLIGCVFRDSSRYGIEYYGTVTNIQLEHCLGDRNQLGGYNIPNARVVDWHNGGSPKGIIGQELWRYVPPTDINGVVRETADAGAYAA